MNLPTRWNFSSLTRSSAAMVPRLPFCSNCRLRLEASLSNLTFKNGAHGVGAHGALYGSNRVLENIDIGNRG
jgi:hypothetical protein